MEEKIVISHRRNNREVILRPEADSAAVVKRRGGMKTVVADRIVGRSKFIIKVSLIAAALICVLMLMLHTLMNIFPYVIMLDGNAVCYVRGEYGVKHAYSELVELYTPEGTELKAVHIGDRITYERKDITLVDRTEIVSSRNAAAALKSAFENAEEPVEVEIASTKTELEKYVPEPQYVKDKTMLAGRSKTKKKGRDGKQKVTTTYHSVNGKVISHSVTRREVVDEGKPKTIRKGILGLPKGADWKTFDGDPVYKNGKELVTTAMQYRGAPYRYGGYSLTNGIDCVQFVRQMYSKYGISLPNSHSGLQHSGIGVKYKNAKKGDIICYGNHVGIYIGNGKMVNAVRRGVSVSRVRTGRIKTVRRIVK